MKGKVISGILLVLVGCSPSVATPPPDLEIEGRIGFVSDEGGRSSIHVMNGDGSNPERIELEDMEHDVYAAAWFPDGRCLAFVTGDLNVGGDLYLASADGSNVRRIVDSDIRNPSWSPTGECLAVQAGNDIALLCSDGSVTTIFHESGKSFFSPEWSPDGSRLAVSSLQQVNVVNSNGTGREDISIPALSWVAYPTWSPDGGSIAFVGRTEESHEIYVVDANSDLSFPSSAQLTERNTKSGTPEYLSWSPDGRFIAFQGLVDGKYDIFVVDIQDKSIYNLTHSSANEMFPVWLPSESNEIDNAFCPTS